METLRLIRDEATLRRYLVNSIKPVAGERPMIERLQPYLFMAEDYVRNEVAGEALFDSMAEETSPMAAMACAYVAMSALAAATRALDVVVTPNGFGVVSTQTIAPASRDRTESFRRSCIAQANKALARLLRRLEAVSEWAGTPQCTYFHGTTFPGMLLCESVASPDEDWAEIYPELMERAREVEEELAVHFISAPLMSHLRGSQLNEQERHVAGVIRGQVVAKLKERPLNVSFLRDTVEFIRRQPKIFPLWTESETAKLYAPPVFQNDRNSSGFFFG